MPDPVSIPFSADSADGFYLELDGKRRFIDYNRMNRPGKNYTLEWVPKKKDKKEENKKPIVERNRSIFVDGEFICEVPLEKIETVPKLKDFIKNHNQLWSLVDSTGQVQGYFKGPSGSAGLKSWGLDHNEKYNLYLKSHNGINKIKLNKAQSWAEKRRGWLS